MGAERQNCTISMDKKCVRCAVIRVQSNTVFMKYHLLVIHVNERYSEGKSECKLC